MEVGAVLALAEQVAHERRHRAAIQAQIRASATNIRTEESAEREAASGADPEIIKQNLAQLRQLRDQIVRKA